MFHTGVGFVSDGVDGAVSGSPSRIGRLGRRLRALVAPLGSRSALSLRAQLLILPAAWVAQIVTLQAGYGGSLGWWLVVSALGLGVVLAGLAAVRRLLDARVPGPLFVLGVFEALSLTRSLLVGLVSVAWGLAPALDVPTALLSGLVTGPALLAVGAYVVSRHDAHRALVADLEAKRQTLLETERTMDAELARTTAELSDAVGTTLQPAIRALEEALDAAARGASTGPVLTALTELIDDRVRPLSHQLVDEPAESTAHEGPTATLPVRVRVPVPARCRVGVGIRPAPAALLGALVASAPAFHDLSPLAATTYLLALGGWTWAALAVARRILGHLELRTPATVAAVAAIHVVATRPFAPLFIAAGGHVPAGTEITGILIWALIGSSFILIPLVGARRAATEAELAVTVDRLTDTVGIIRRRATLTRRRLAHLLHGNLQGALLAAAVRLSATPIPSAGLIESVRADIEAALARLHHDPGETPAPLNRTLQEIIGTWGEQRSITATVEPTAAATLADHPDAEQAVAMIVREAITNALRHGRARSVEARIAHRDGQGHDPQVVEIVVCDDGTGWPAESRPGLGTATFDELSRAWSYDSDGNGTRFSALVTVA